MYYLRKYNDDIYEHLNENFNLDIPKHWIVKHLNGVTYNNYKEISIIQYNRRFVEDPDGRIYSFKIKIQNENPEPISIISLTPYPNIVDGSSHIVGVIINSCGIGGSNYNCAIELRFEPQPITINGISIWGTPDTSLIIVFKYLGKEMTRTFNWPAEIGENGGNSGKG